MGLKYKVVYRMDTADLEEEVNKLLGEGWELLGGVSCAYNKYPDSYSTSEDGSLIESNTTSEELMFSQALIKYN